MSDAHLKELLREEYRRRKDKGEKGEKSERSEKKTPKVRTDKEKEEKEKRRRERERERERNRDKDRTDKREERDERSERSEKSERKEERESRSERPERSERSERPERAERSERSERSERVERSEQTEKVVEIVAEVPTSSTEKFIFVYEDEAGVLYNDLQKIPLSEGNTVKIFPVYLSGHNENLTEEVVTFRDGKLSPMDENKDSSWLNVINSRDENIEILTFDLDQVVVYNNRFFHCQDDLYDHLEANGCEYISVKKF